MGTRIRCVLFDLDGTLADTAPDLVAALNQVLRTRGRPALSVQDLRATVSLGGAAMVRHAFGIADDDPDFPALLEAFLDHYDDSVADRTTLFPGLVELLDALEARGCAWGVVTNKGSRFTAPIMTALGLDGRAACVVAGDTVAERKPHPGPLLHACEVVGCDPAEAVYVGDARRDVEAARSAGMAVLVAGFGYVDAGDPPEAWGADAVVQTPDQILLWLERGSDG